MTTFKNNSKYAELLFTYLELAERGDTPVTTDDVLRVFKWQFKGGNMGEAARGTRLCPDTSQTVFPHGSCEDLLSASPLGAHYIALKRITQSRLLAGRLKSRGVTARLGTYMMLTSDYGRPQGNLQIYTGMHSIYQIYSRIWEWAVKGKPDKNWDLLQDFTQELVLGTSGVSRIDIPSALEAKRRYQRLVESSRVPRLLEAIRQVKGLIFAVGSAQARALALATGRHQMELWKDCIGVGCSELASLDYSEDPTMQMLHTVGPVVFRVSQRVCMTGAGTMRYALGMSDMERLHQLLMSTSSAIVGVCAQACVGTRRQQLKAKLAVEIVERNMSRLVVSTRLIPLGDEVLVCKGYRRAYTAHLGWLAGPMCEEETKVLKQEAEETAPHGVLDVDGFLSDAKRLDAANALNVCKVFKVCPAPDVSPGGSMIDRIKQIGDGNIVDQSIMPEFEVELRTQILRGYIRSTRKRLELRDVTKKPLWYPAYLRANYDEVPSAEIDEYLKWESTAEMPEISIYDPSNWKDSGLGVDTIRETFDDQPDRKKKNMITRLLFDDDCPMPGSMRLSDDRVIKFFLKAEGHKDPARGIFSANLRDRQAQSWMERAVDQVAKEHPSYMIGQEIDVRAAKTMQLTAVPKRHGEIALYYSFDISGWSAKMPAEPQRISHKIWGELFGGHLFSRASAINEGAYIYLNLDGYKGWFRNTHANLEGFNGKEMTMVLVALLSLSVRRWRRVVVERGIMTQLQANGVSALLFAYIDDGLSRIDLPRQYAAEAFTLYKDTVIDTFKKCGFTVEVSKCFPSDRFSIFLNEVYIAGRHVVHGVRAAMGISSEPTERHTSLVERVTTVSTGVRGAVMAGLSPLSGMILMAYHVLMHLLEWVDERDPVILATWCVTPRAWAGLGLPNMLQLFVSGSGSAFEEGIATLQSYARINEAAKKVFIKLARTALIDRDPVGILTAPLSARIEDGYMVDSRVAVAIRIALQNHMEAGCLSKYASRLLKYADTRSYRFYAEAIVPRDRNEVLQEQMLNNLAEAHPHAVFAGFARRVEKSVTLSSIVGQTVFKGILEKNREEAKASVSYHRGRAMR